MEDTSKGLEEEPMGRGEKRGVGDMRASVLRVGTCMATQTTGGRAHQIAVKKAFHHDWSGWRKVSIYPHVRMAAGDDRGRGHRPD